MLTRKPIWTAVALAVLAVTVTACATPTPTPGLDQIRQQVAEILSGDVSRFEVVEVDMAVLVESLEAGRILLPLADPDNQIVELELAAQPVQLRAEGVTEGGLRSGPGEVELVPLTQEQNFRIGECVSKEEEFNGCGSLTILDEGQTMIGGLLVHQELGLTFFEPVDLIIGGRENPGLHIIYNVTGTEVIDFGEGEEPEVIALQPAKAPGMSADLYLATAYRDTNIVLDGDVSFYEIDKSTVWSRQEEVFNAVSIVYGFIEPLSAESPNISNWGLDLDIKGQEVWISDGPTTTDGDDLIDEITDPNYFLLNPVTDTELHYLFIGYDVTDLYGQAAGIGSSSGFGGGPGENHAFGDGRSGSSLKTRWVVMAHEVGHLLGGMHGDGVDPGCTTFFIFWQICGTSIMLGGGAGAPGPDKRAPFFSDANDDNIATVLNSVLP